MIALGLFVAGVRLAEWLPAWLLYGAAWLLGAGLGRLPLPAQRRLADNLAVVLRIRPGDPVVWRCVRMATQLHVANYLDLFRSRVVGDEQVSRQFVQEGDGWASWRETLAAGRGLVLVTAHFGRFELLSHYLGFLGHSVTLPVERLDPPALFEFVCRLRQRPNFHLIPHDSALRPSLRALGRGDVVAFFADWDPSGHSVEVEFFGRATHLPGGPAYIARRAGAPLYVGFAIADAKAGVYHAVLEPPLPVPHTADLDQDVRQATQAIAAVFERYIGAYPAQWVMFHRIWSA
jgi:KDO2-lipid IV(A) lauroyltransferase